MKALLLACSCGLSLGLWAVPMNLEWNATYDTAVPYEVEISPVKLAQLGGVPSGSGFVVSADGAALKTVLLPGKNPGCVRLRFTVPAGTKKLTCDAGVGKATLADPKQVDNLFADALVPANVGKWVLPEDVTAEAKENGILFSRTKSGKSNRVYVTYTIDVPEGLAGKPVRQEIDATGLGQLAWGGFITIQQLDAKGKKLPETLCDSRWTSHMRPPKKLAQYRDEGHIHPQARKLRASFELRTLSATYDAYGMKITDPTTCLPKLLISHLAVRAAAELPFPKWDDACFGPGVSGELSDTALRLGGMDGKALFYQTHSRGVWTCSEQLRKEEDLFFPSAAGTVEGWFRPEWSTLQARRKAANLKEVPVVLFEAYQGYRAAQMLQGKGPMLQLSYRPVKKEIKLLLRDWQDHVYTKIFKAVTLAEGAWSHVALQWEPLKEAALYINGQVVGTLPIPEYAAIPIEDKSIKNVNDLWALEFFIGSNCSSARLAKSGPHDDSPFFEGLVDNVRVSTGLRYAGAFTPAKAFKVDAATRAFFAFDRAFDGVSGGGFAFIPASYRRDIDRVDHVLQLGDKRVQYYPATNLPANDPAKVLDILNYPVMPKVSEYFAATKTCTQTARLTAGKTLAVTCRPTTYPEYVEFINLSETQTLDYPILVNKGRLDPRSFGDLADTLGLEGLTDREKANRTFQYVLSASDYFMNHQICLAAGSDVPHSACYEAMIMLNSYCGFECGPLNNMTANMFATVAYCPASQTAGYGHSFEQVFYDGKNHIYDLSAQKFFPAMDNETAAYLKESGDQPAIHNRVGGSPDHFIRKATRNTDAQNPSYQEKCAMTLNPGETFRVWYSNNGHMNNLQTWPRKGVYGRGHRGFSLDEYNFVDVAGMDDKSHWVKRFDRIFPHYSTGILTRHGPVAASNPALSQVTESSFCYRVRSCYPIVWGEYAARDAAGKPIEIEISTDLGKTFKKLPQGANGSYTLEYRVKARHDYLLRVKAPLARVADLSLCTEGEVNTRTYPGWVTAGANDLTFKAGSQVPAQVTVAWREPVKDIVVKGGAYSGTIPGCERQLVVVDPAQPLTLEVTGVSPTATVRTQGRVKAELAQGQLKLSYAAEKPLAFTRGDDLEAWYASGASDVPERHTFPSVAGVAIVDGECVKNLTVIVSPNARLVFAPTATRVGDLPLQAADGNSPQDRLYFTKESERATFTYPALPAGKYEVFALARFASHPDRRCPLRLINPNPKTIKADKDYVLARYINGNEDYLKAHYAHKGERARWKWDTVNLEGKQYGQTSYSGWIIRTLDFPETDHLDVKIPFNHAEGIELAALLILPDPDLECRADLRKVLFGLNCDPFKVR